MTADSDTKMVRVRLVLQTGRCSLAHENLNDPTPISGCDAQFNHLLAKRTQIGRAIDAMTVAILVPTPRSATPLAGVESR
jgi:hypothetical protein